MPSSGKPIFHAFTTRFNGRVNRIINEIKVTRAFDPAHPPDPPFPEYGTYALWDTGATNSVLTKSTVLALGLIPTGTVMVNHAGGASRSNQYLVNIFLPNHVGVPGVPVSECEEIVGGCGAIIGMDIISNGDFSVTNRNGLTWVSFRLPSIDSIDYVAEANRIMFAGTSRNAPCPCGKKDAGGSPVKFKHCHGK